MPEAIPTSSGLILDNIILAIRVEITLILNPKTNCLPFNTK